MLRNILVFSLLMTPWFNSWGQDFTIGIPMYKKDAQTFYVSGRIAGMRGEEFMVDTGSSYMTINEATLASLLGRGQARYVKNLIGVLANGVEVEVPIYSISMVEIGNRCKLKDVEAAVFPGNTRQILGLSALSMASPFIFSMDPPQLMLSNCGAPLAETKGGQENLATVAISQQAL